MSHYNFGAKGNSLTLTLLCDVLLGWRDNTGTTFEEHCPLRIKEGKKHPKFCAIWDSFRLWPRISLEQMELLTSS